MDLREFCALLRRQWLTLFVIIFVTMAATTVIYLQLPANQKTTLLYSVGLSATDAAKNDFDLTRTGDDFARTISGWFRSPNLSTKIGALVESEVAASSNPQAKQNFLVELSFTDAALTDRVSAAAKQVLSEEIARYNAASKYQFFASLHGETTGETRPSLPLGLATALLSGLILATAWIVMWNYFAGRIGSVSEAEQLLGSHAAIQFRSPSDPELAFLDTLLARLGKHAVLAGADVNPKPIADKLGIKPTTAELPKEAAVFGREHLALAVIVRLDETRASTLRQIRAATDGKIKLIIWG
jgi:capsular polysaccharide biosynthesis protein